MAQADVQNHRPVSIVTLQAQVHERPDDGEAWLALAQALANKTPGRELSQAISRSIELLPDEFQAWLLAGMELRYHKGIQPAITWLSQVGRQRPALAAPRLALAQLQALENPLAAETTYRSVIADFPGDARGHLLLAECLQNQGKIGEAGDELEAALRIKPDVAQNWSSLALLRLTEFRLREAIKAATRALELDQEAVEPRLVRADIYRQAAQWDQAMQDYHLVERMLPENPYVMLGIGACHAGTGKFDEALSYFNRSLAIKPDLTEATLNIALIKCQLGELQEASSLLAKVLQTPSLPGPLLEAAQSANLLLQEQLSTARRLSGLDDAECLGVFRQASARMPGELSQPAGKFVDRMQQMAQACQDTEFRSFELVDSIDYESQQFMEACLLGRDAVEPEAMFSIWQEIASASGDEMKLSPAALKVQRTWRVLKHRRAQLCADPGHRDGDAWLRYWHYRLMSHSPVHRPGMYKLAPNSIGMHETVAPQCVAATFRVLMDDIRPAIPPGTARAAFMLAAINLVHGFIDGNGRLARFFFAGEMEMADQRPVLFVAGNRNELVHCLDQAHYENSFEAFSNLISELDRQTRELSMKFANLQSA